MRVQIESKAGSDLRGLDSWRLGVSHAPTPFLSSLPPLKVPAGVRLGSGSVQPTMSEPPAPLPQPLYQFYLDKCVITNTRSVHEDTLLAGLGVIVTNGTEVSPPLIACAKVGNHNNTTFEFWQQGLGSLDNIGVQPGATVTFLYEMYNNGAHGHPTADELKQLIGDHLKLQAATNALNASNPTLAAALVTQQELIQLQQQIASAGANATAKSTVVASTIFTGGMYGLFYSAIEGCDGIVAAGTYSATGATLVQRLASAPNKVIAQTDTSNGKQNGWGAPCNPHGSNYLISWIAQARGQGVSSL